MNTKHFTSTRGGAKAVELFTFSVCLDLLVYTTCSEAAFGSPTSKPLTP